MSEVRSFYKPSPQSVPGFPTKKKKKKKVTKKHMDMLLDNSSADGEGDQS